MLTTPAAAASGSTGSSGCAREAADFIHAPKGHGNAAFTISSPVTNDGSKVATVRFLKDNKLEITTVKSNETTYTPVPGNPEAPEWEFEPAGRPGNPSPGTMNFATVVQDSEGNLYVTAFAVTIPVCQKGSSRVAELRGTRTTLFVTANGGQEFEGLPGAYSASR
ncbi:hypothetical protein ACTVZO_39585 [Streptomyces sp. IBSNAI002]|uniref:hypothetical protein n=1 Tax=Streptomyces sp. IBSNAI002 TaxID=3457500 RepID=UPI003FD43DAA